MNFLRNSKAVSPIIASMLAVVIVVSIGSYILAQASVMINKARDTAREDFIIEDVWFREVNGTRTINITVYNTGEITLTLSTVYINGSLVYSPDAELDPDSWLSFEFEYEWVDGVAYGIKVVSERGTEAYGIYKAPVLGD